MHGSARLITAAWLALVASRGASAQTLSSVTNPALPIPAPNETQYENVITASGR
jgi:hypothetical protein